MNIYVGTSGYSYKEWKGNFYPGDLPAKRMLRYYGDRFRTVEIKTVTIFSHAFGTGLSWLYILHTQSA